MRLNFRNKIFFLCVSLVVAVVLTSSFIIDRQAGSQATKTLSLDIEITQRTFEEFIQLERQQRQLLSNTLAFEPRMKAALDTRDPATVQGFLERGLLPGFLFLVDLSQFGLVEHFQASSSAINGSG